MYLINIFSSISSNIGVYNSFAIRLRAKNVDLTHSKIYFQGILLTGSNELPNNPFYFGELDQDNAIKQDTP
ncbi:hypothetical protein ACHII6_10100, partial [Campylobacter coli]